MLLPTIHASGGAIANILIVTIFLTSAALWNGFNFNQHVLQFGQDEIIPILNCVRSYTGINDMSVLVSCAFSKLLSCQIPIPSVCFWFRLSTESIWKMPQSTDLNVSSGSFVLHKDECPMIVYCWWIYLDTIVSGITMSHWLASVEWALSIPSVISLLKCKWAITSGSWRYHKLNWRGRRSLFLRLHLAIFFFFS